MNDQELMALTLRATANVLSRRAIVLAGLVTTFVLALWAMFDPTWIHAAIAGGYGLLSWVYCNVEGLLRRENL